MNAPLTYVLDTSVVLADPHSIFRFAEHHVVLPIVVITELEGKRHHSELGYFARQSLRILDDLREKHGTLAEPLPIGDQGGTVRVELNHQSPENLPDGFRLGDNDTRILSVAKNLQVEGAEVTLVSKDLPMRIKASASGLKAEEYRAELARDRAYTGITSADITEEQMAALWSDEGGARHTGIEIPELADLGIHTGLKLTSPRGSALGRVLPNGNVRLVPGDGNVFGVTGRSAEQRIAIDLLLDDELSIVSLGGRAGTGKSALALCAGLEAVLENATSARSWCSGPCTR